MPGRWVRLWDDLLDSATWNSTTSRQWRLATVLILRANWRKTSIFVHGQRVTIERSELLDSLDTLADRCSSDTERWTRKAVRSALQRLKDIEFVRSRKVANRGTGLKAITVINYDIFNPIDVEVGHSEGHRQGHSEGPDPRSKERKKKIYRDTSRALPGLIYPVGRRPDPNGGVPVSSFQYRCSNCRETMLIEDIAKHETLCRECRAPFGEEAAS